MLTFSILVEKTTRKMKEKNLHDELKVSNMTSTKIDIDEILFGDRLRAELKKAKKEMRAAMQKEVRAELQKNSQFKKLGTILNLIKKLPNLSNEEYTVIIGTTQPDFIEKIKLLLAKKNKQSIKKELSLLAFEGLKLNAADNKQLGKMIKDHLK